MFRYKEVWPLNLCLIKGGVTSVFVSDKEVWPWNLCVIEGGVASVSSSSSKGGVAYVPANFNEGISMASISNGEEGVASSLALLVLVKKAWSKYLLVLIKQQ